MQIAPFFLPVAQHSLHAVGKELLPQYKQLYDYMLRGGAAALPLVLFALKVFATVGFLVNIGWKVWWIEEMIVCIQPNRSMLHAVKYNSDWLSADFCIGYCQRFITVFMN